MAAPIQKSLENRIGELMDKFRATISFPHVDTQKFRNLFNDTNWTDMLADAARFEAEASLPKERVRFPCNDCDMAGHCLSWRASPCKFPDGSSATNYMSIPMSEWQEMVEEVEKLRKQTSELDGMLQETEKLRKEVVEAQRIAAEQAFTAATTETKELAASGDEKPNDYVLGSYSWINED